MQTHHFTDEQAIRTLMENWTAAVRAGDVEAIMACYADELVAYDAIQQLEFRGKAAYRDHWQMCMTMCPAGLAFQMHGLQVHSGGDSGFAHALVGCGAANDARTCWSRMSTGFLRQAGQWRIVHEHFSFPFDMRTGKAMMHLNPDGSAQSLPVPPDMNTLTPHLVCADVPAAMAFYENAFGAQPGARLAGPGGQIMHANMRIGDSMIMLMPDSTQCPSGESPAGTAPAGIVLHLYVDDADAAFERAVAAGARAVFPLGDMFWGDRYGVVQDPFGQRWAIASHQRDVSAEAMQQAVERLAVG